MAAITLQFDGYEEMKSFARKLIQGDACSESPQITKPIPEKTTNPVVDVALEPETEIQERTNETEVATYSLEDVRAKLAALNKAGKRDAVQTLIASYGAGKLTEIADSRYPDLMQKAGEL